MKCTELLRVRPGDEMGPQRESLLSLIVRTAAENDVSPAKLLTLKFNDPESRDSPKLISRTVGASLGKSINGGGRIASYFIQKTEALTQLNNLSASTTTAFSKFTPENGLLRNKLAWSPGFLSDHPTEYYPLLWALDATRVCLHTNKPLASACPLCRNELNVLSGAMRIGKCYRCGTNLSAMDKHLGVTNPLAQGIKNIDYEIWVARELGNFIKYQASHELPTDLSFSLSFRFWLNKFGLKNDSKSSTQLGITTQAMHNWFSKKTKPRLRMTLNLCWIFNLPLLDFLLCQQPISHSGILRPSADAGERHATTSVRRPLDKSKMEIRLNNIIDQNLHALVSFSEICRKHIKRSDIFIRQCFPELSRKISQRYLHNRKLLAQLKQDQYCTAIKSIARHLHGNGIIPNHKTIAQYVEQPGKLRCAYAIEALREVRVELGYYNHERLLSFR
jgi:hypothetical protein